MITIPAIDLMDGKAVRLTKGSFNTIKEYGDPLEVAKRSEDAGLTRLHMVDLEGARTGNVREWKMLEKIATRTKLMIDFSGGISSQEDLRKIFNSGATYAAIGSMAVTNEKMVSDWLFAYDAERFIIGADTIDGEQLAIRGWTESTQVSVTNHIERYRAKGIRQFFSTDIRKDGMLQGPATGLYKRLSKQFPDIFLIASGGVSSVEDLHALHDAGCKAAIVGKAIYENKISLKELSGFAL